MKEHDNLSLITQVGEDIVDGVRRQLGNRAMFHYTIRRLDIRSGEMFGGLHEEEKDAKCAREKLAQKWGNGIGVNEAWRNADIVTLAPGEEYVPFANGGKVVRHGIDDGATHTPKLESQEKAA